MRIIKLKLFPAPVRLPSDSGKLIFVIIPLCFAIFNNVVHSDYSCDSTETETRSVLSGSIYIIEQSWTSGEFIKRINTAYL